MCTILKWKPTIAFFVLILVVLSSCSRTPLSLAARFSELDLPRDAKVIECIDEASGLAGEDLYVKVILEVTEVQLESILIEAISEGFKAEDSTMIVYQKSSSSSDESCITIINKKTRIIHIEKTII